MFRIRQKRDTIQAVDIRIKRQEERHPTQGEIMKIRHTSVDLRIKGSAKLWRNVPVRGAFSSLSVGDIVPLGWWRNRPEVVS